MSRLGEIRNTFQMELETTLTLEERDAVGRAWCAKLDEVAAADEEEKARHKAAKAEIEKAEIEASAMQDIYRSGKEKRTIEVEGRVDYQSNAYRVYRLDTGALVSERALEAEERQREFEWGSSIRAEGGNAPPSYDRGEEPPAGQGTRREALAAVPRPGDEYLPPEADHGWGELDVKSVLTDDDTGLIPVGDAETEPEVIETPKRGKGRKDRDPVLQAGRPKGVADDDGADFG